MWEGRVTRKGLTRRKLLASAAGIGSLAIIGRTRAATPYKPSDSLLEAARREGKFLLYTATFTEVEQEVINEFRKRFPFIRFGSHALDQLPTRRPDHLDADEGKPLAEFVDDPGAG